MSRRLLLCALTMIVGLAPLMAQQAQQGRQGWTAAAARDGRRGL